MAVSRIKQLFCARHHTKFFSHASSLRKIYFYFMYVGALPACMCVHHRSQKGVPYFRYGVKDSYELPCGWLQPGWESNLAPLLRAAANSPSRRTVSPAPLSQFLKALQQINYASVAQLSENAPTSYPDPVPGRVRVGYYGCSPLGRGVSSQELR